MGDECEYDIDLLEGWQDEQMELFPPSEWGSDHADIFAMLKRKARERSKRPKRFPRGMLAPPGEIAIFDKKALFEELDGAAKRDPAAEYSDGESSYSDLSSEETARMQALEALARDPRGPYRPQLMVKDKSLIDRVRAIAREAPHFGKVIEVVARAATLALMTGTELRLPHILLSGPPGIGKSWFSKRLAEALGTDTHSIAGNAITDAALLLGHPTTWKGAKQGLVTDIASKSTTASPIILCDELDKLKTHYSEDPFNVFLTFLERENASRAMDEYLLVPFDISRIIWILTANDLRRIPEPVISRLLVFEIDAPLESQLIEVVRNMVGEALARFGEDGFAIEDEVVGRLAKHGPRQIARLIDLSLGFAADAGRKELRVVDVEQAETLFVEPPAPDQEPEEAPIKMGFLPTMAIGKPL